MADDVAIRVKNLSKRYKLGQQTSGYKTLGETITRAVKSPFQRLQHLDSLEEKEEAGTFWALKDLSFEVKKGEVLGIIGRNGAGKSTLLKILSRITAPTEGTVEINGRIGSLLEVGTGFHPELTGRENIFLSGSIMGMKKAEIEEKFDDIVKFSEVEQFLDTPVKRYSSGMYVRLAFAVAAHLDPEILIVDEVLAVGDAEFQKKCLGKMGDVAKGGRTVLFVSHNMAAIQQLCPRVILIENGKISLEGSSEGVINKYLHNNNSEQCVVDLSNYQYRQGTGEVSFLNARIQDNTHQDCCNFSMGEDVNIIYNIKPRSDFTGSVKLSIKIRTFDGLQLFNIIDADSGFNIGQLKCESVVSISIKDIRLYPGAYFISLGAGNQSSTEVYDLIEDILCFHIIGGGLLTTRYLPQESGLFFITPVWEILNND